LEDLAAAIVLVQFNEITGFAKTLLSSWSELQPTPVADLFRLNVFVSQGLRSTAETWMPPVGKATPTKAACSSGARFTPLMKRLVCVSSASCLS